MPIGNRARIARKILFVSWFVLAAFTAISTIGTSFYLLNEPRTPDPQTGRVYPTGAAYGTLVYATKKESDWQNFVHYDLMTAVGSGVVVIGIIVMVRWHRGEPPINKFQDFWS